MFHFFSKAAPHARINLAALILRLALAVIFLYHGLDKIVARDNDMGTAWATKMWQQQPGGPPMPPALAYTATQLAVAWGEFACGLTLVIGLLSRVAALGMIVVQAGAIALVTYAIGFSVAGGGGYEYNLALLAMCLAILILGSGAVSVDRWLSHVSEKAHQRKASAMPELAGAPK